MKQAFQPCPRCGHRAVYIVGGTQRIRRHSPLGRDHGQFWCPEGGKALVNALADLEVENREAP